MMLRTDIKSGAYEVLDSKTVTLYRKDNNLSIKVTAENGFTFDIVWDFIDEKDSKMKMESEGKDGVITFHCTNFNSSLGVGTNSPIQIASIEGKKIYIHFWIYLLGSAVRKVEYTILGEA